jgi:hypothetical protein
VILFETMRYIMKPGRGDAERWVVDLKPGRFREFEGIRILATSSFTWKLAGGDFAWLHMDITDARYNAP